MGTDNKTIEFALPKLKELELSNLPELTSICSTNGVMVCGSLQRMKIIHCPKLKRFPLKETPLRLEEICVDPEDWWKSVKWDNTDAKDVLRPFLKFYGGLNRGWKLFDELPLKA